ncbi:MAG TPA: sugar ABC transporter, partial [Paenibacillus sp.]|nr:sugar ABC transporter [Paenibacillus sp.]
MKLNKWLAGLLSLIVVVTAACSNGSGGEAESGEKAADPASSAVTPAAETPAAEETAKGPATGKFDPPVTITTARSIGADITFINGEDVHNNVHNTWAKDKLGIEIKDLWNTADLTAYYTKLRLSLSTAEPLPDVFIVQDTNLIADLIQSGKVRDIQADFDAYAPERIKQVYADNAGALNQVKTDGKLMGLPIFTAGDGTNAVLWIQQDWLDKLNLQAPKTMAEFEQVMDAFVNQDPDGNGKKDTIGFSFSARDGFANWMSDASFIFGSQTGKFIPMLWQEGEDGTLKYGSVQPGIKESLAKLRDWFAKGYLDPEVAALDAMKATESFIQGKSGMIAAPYWANGWPLGDVAASNPNAVVRAYALPTGDDGKAARFSTSLNEGKVMMFSKD